MNFLAGLFAGAGINMITSVATSPDGDAPTLAIGLDSATWVLAAAFLTWAAQVLQSAERDADLQIAPDFSARERQQVRDLYRQESLRAVRIPLGLTVISLLAAIALLPGLIRWSALF